MRKKRKRVDIRSLTLLPGPPTDIIRRKSWKCEGCGEDCRKGHTFFYGFDVGDTGHHLVLCVGCNRRARR